MLANNVLIIERFSSLSKETSRVTESPTIAATTNSTMGTSDPGGQTDDLAIVLGSVVGAVLIVLVLLSVVFILYCVKRRMKLYSVKRKIKLYKAQQLQDGSDGNLEMK